jgi:peptidoglycan lytic transglycosylase F
LRAPKRLIPLLFGAALLATSCTRVDPWKQSDEMVVAVLDDPVFYQPGTTANEASGFDYDLVRAFAAELKVKLRLIPARSPAQIREMMAEGIVRFATSVAIQPTQDYRYTQPLREARLLVLQHADELPLDEPKDLIGHTIEVSADGAAERALRALPIGGSLSIKADRSANGVDLIGRVENHSADLVATDSAHLDIADNFYPDVTVAQELPGKVVYSWVFRPKDESLRARADAFISQAKQDGLVARIKDRYFGHVHRINANGAAKFISDMRTRLPTFRALFEKAQAITGIDWRLLAALSYQESKWDPLATSYTGVRGIMMLTEETADRMHVSNRLDPQEAIIAGAKYLAELMDELPDDVKEPDRNWLALAAYNLGMGHLRGARQFAVGMHRDPNSWYDMKKVLPLLARPEYYTRLKAGRARGGEAVILVENVRTFYDILTHFEPAEHQPLTTGLIHALSGSRVSGPSMRSPSATGITKLPSAR